MFFSKEGMFLPERAGGVLMGSLRLRCRGRAAGAVAAVIEKTWAGMVLVCLIAVAPAVAQAPVRVHESDSSQRLVSTQEGRAIVNVAWQLEQVESGAADCSHLVHAIYASAGFEYPYATSFEIYAGNENFARVKAPHPGDVIAWPGHVGIVVDPLQHSFYSLVRTGLEAQDYESAYWRSRGRPRFYRYKVEKAGVLTAVKAPTRARGRSLQSQNLAESEEDGQAEGRD